MSQDTSNTYNTISDTNTIKRKCGYCGELLYMTKEENIKDAIYYDKKTYHSRCFIKQCKKNIESKRTKPNTKEKWKDALDNIDKIKDDSYMHFLNMLAKDEIFDFIMDKYDLTIVPTPVWHKLAAVYNGTFKGMSRGIPPAHLLDMWERQIDSLNKIAENNKTKGKGMSNDQRVIYDLSILINRYNSYLNWLEKQRILEAEQAVEKMQNSRNSIGDIDYYSNIVFKNDRHEKYSKKYQNQNNYNDNCNNGNYSKYSSYSSSYGNNNNDISSVVNDIFGES